MRDSSDLLWLVILGGIAIVVLVGVPFSWREWLRERRAVQGASLKRLAIDAAIVAVTFEAALFFLLWVPKLWDSPLVFWVARVDLVCFIVGLVCAFAWRGKARWWLRGCAFLLPIISMMLVVGITAE